VDERGPLSQARVQAIADEITRQTGLHVDITIGSSTTRTLVQVPGWGDIAPLGYLEERWVAPGANLAIEHGLQWANLAIGAAALPTCACAVALLVAVSVIGRGVQWSLLAALGWRRRSIVRLLLMEALLLGGVGSVGGLGLGWLVLRVVHLSADGRALMTGLILAILPGPLTVLAVRFDTLGRAHGPLVGPLVGGARRSEGRPLTAFRVFWANGLGAPRATALANGVVLSAAVGLLLLGLGRHLDLTWGATRLGEHIVNVTRLFYDVLAALCLAIAMLATGALMASVVRRCRREIAICLAFGWRPQHVSGAILTQVALMGLAAGLAGSVGALTLLALAGVAAPDRLIVLPAIGVPVALLTSVLGALWPVWRSVADMPRSALVEL
jgi:putative ABC transport system permease protein